MDIGKTIVNLQERVSSTLNTFDQLVLAKSIEKLKVGAVQSVSTYANLPTLPLDSDGSLFIVEDDEDLYYNVGSTWKRFRINKYDVLSWGVNDQGQLGINSYINQSSPVTVVGGITNWSQVSVMCGIAGGVAYTWGLNSAGQLGRNNTIPTSSPITVVGGITDWTSISKRGLNTTLGIANGIAYGWGSNGSGQIGDNTATTRSSPVTVVGGITNWSQISCGLNHTLAITDTGIAYAWGSGGDGRLGTNNIVSTSSPVTVVGGITGWSHISAGHSHSLGIANGVAYGWGNYASGRVGDGFAIERSSPVTVVGGITNWTKVAAGNSSSFGIANGIVYAWGNNFYSNLGDGTNTTRSSPVTVVGGITNWSDIDTGDSDTLAITSDGSAYGWGRNNEGQLGDGTTTARSSPVTLLVGSTDWAQLVIAIGSNISHGLKIK